MSKMKHLYSSYTFVKKRSGLPTPFLSLLSNMYLLFIQA